VEIECWPAANGASGASMTKSMKYALHSNGVYLAVDHAADDINDRALGFMPVAGEENVENNDLGFRYDAKHLKFAEFARAMRVL
jgi:hypothetical protein